MYIQSSISTVFLNIDAQWNTYGLLDIFYNYSTYPSTILQPSTTVATGQPQGLGQQNHWKGGAWRGFIQLGDPEDGKIADLNH